MEEKKNSKITIYILGFIIVCMAGFLAYTLSNNTSTAKEVDSQDELNNNNNEPVQEENKDNEKEELQPQQPTPQPQQPKPQAKFDFTAMKNGDFSGSSSNRVGKW